MAKVEQLNCCVSQIADTEGLTRILLHHRHETREFISSGLALSPAIRIASFLILTHPTSHNIEWPDVLSLLEVVGTVDEGREGKVTVTLETETETFDRANKKDLDVQTIVDLRRMLHGAGYDAPAP